MSQYCRDSVGVKIPFGHAQIHLYDLLGAQKSELCFLLWATDRREKIDYRLTEI